MTDVLIRNVPDDVLQRIDEKASRLGLSRGEYLRRQITAEAERGAERLSVDQLAKFASLADAELMRDAWS